MRLTITCCLAALLLATPATAPSAKAETGASLGIAAIVNDDIISSLDVEDRLRIAIGNTGLSDTPDVREKLRPQILRQLIDEKLRTQQANARGITVSQKDVDDAVANIEKQNRRPPGSFEVFLREKNMPVRSFFEQIKSQIAWSKLVMKEWRRRGCVREEEIAQK